MTPLLLDEVPCYQVVFTIPDVLSSLTLGNRPAMFNLLFRSAWQSLKSAVESEQQFEAAAVMVLHTWNQQLESHVHVHAVVPGGGPSLKNAERWKRATPPPHERSDRWWLCDADDLRHEFRERFLAGLRRLHANNELQLDGDWASLRDDATFDDYLAPLEKTSWVTYIQAPPQEGSSPGDVVKYLARYLTGGPISDRRITNVSRSFVTFTARTGTTHGGSDETEDVRLPVVEFVRRWSLHVLPKGFTKTRRYGGWSNHHRGRYVAQCRQLLDLPEVRPLPELASRTDDEAEAASASYTCPICDSPLERLERVHRTSWRNVFAGDFCPAWYRCREPAG